MYPIAVLVVLHLLMHYTMILAHVSAIVIGYLCKPFQYTLIPRLC
jgi:hypothetical protein